MLELAPIYLLNSTEKMTSDFIVDEGDRLTEGLEEQGFFDTLHDAFVMLNVVSKLKMSEVTRFEIGLSDCFDNFCHTLSDWINELSVKEKIQKGVILINIEDAQALSENSSWWNSLLRTIRYHKRSFIFIFAALKDIDTLKRDISAYHNCAVIPPYLPDIEKLTQGFAEKLQSCGFALSQAAADLVRTQLEADRSIAGPNVVRLWAASTVWGFVTSERSKELPVAPSELDLGYIKEHFSESTAEARQLGFRR